ncbi:MAG: thioredoxin-disulfide reductase [Patescibacteria group bacterium]
MYDVVIIGSGPAGYTAALYTSRAFLKTVLFTGIQIGGQLTTTTDVDNYPGFPKGIDGTQLMMDMKVQVERFGTEVVSDTISNIQSSIPNTEKQKAFVLKGEKGIYEAKTVIVATGATAMYLGLPSENMFAGKGVSACATCDGFFFRGKEVVVVGGGDTAMEEATFLTKFATKVTIIHRRDEFRASAIMLDRAKKDPKISFLLNKEIIEIYGDPVVQGLKLKSGEDIKTDGVFLAIGHRPNTDFLKNVVELDAKGYVVTKKNTETSMLGIFAAGDCVDHRYRQAIVAAGQGCMAAMDAEKYLEEQK